MMLNPLRNLLDDIALTKNPKKESYGKGSIIEYVIVMHEQENTIAKHLGNSISFFISFGNLYHFEEFSR